MTTDKYKIRTIGKELTTPAGVADEPTTVRVTESEGFVYSISINAPYSLIVLSQIYLSIEQNGHQQIEEMPLSELSPEVRSGFPMNLAVPLVPGKDFTAKLISKTASSTSATKVVLILHTSEKK